MPRRLAHFSDPRLDAQIGELIKKHKELQKDIEQLERRLTPITLPDAMPPTEHEHEVADITDFPDAMTPIAHDHGVADITDFPETMAPDVHAVAHESGDDKLTNLAAGLKVGGNTVWHAGNLDPGELGNTRIASGTYTGDDTLERPISVGFQPKFVITASDDSHRAELIMSVSTSGGYVESNIYPALRLTTSGFMVGAEAGKSFGNKSDIVYKWVAFA